MNKQLSIFACENGDFNTIKKLVLNHDFYMPALELAISNGRTDIGYFVLSNFGSDDSDMWKMTRNHIEELIKEYKNNNNKG